MGGLERQRERIRQAGLELAPGKLLAAATGRGARLEGITAVLLLTAEDDFNALASAVLQGNVEGRVYRLAPPLRREGVVAPYTSGEILFGAGMTGSAIGRRYHDGAQIVMQRAEADHLPGLTSCSSCAPTASSPPSPSPACRRRRPGTPSCHWVRRRVRLEP